MDINNIVNSLVNATDEEFAEIFVMYNIIRKSGWTLKAEDIRLKADDMFVDTTEISDFIGDCLSEIIWCDDIDEGAWFKQKGA